MDHQVSVAKVPSRTQGFGLVGVLVAVVIVGLLSLVVATVLSDGQKGQLAIRQRDEFDKLLSYTKLVLATRENCGLDMSSMPSNTFRWTELPVQIDLQQIGSNAEITRTYPMIGVLLTDIKIEIRSRIGTSNRADARIVLGATKTSVTPGAKTFQDSGLPVVIDTIGGLDTDPQYITKCFAMADAVPNEGDPSETCALFGRTYNEESGQCDEPGAAFEAVETLSGNQALKANQVLQSCAVKTNSGALKQYPCNTQVSQNRVTPAAGTVTSVADLAPNTSVSTQNRLFNGACYFEGGQWHRGKYQVPAGTAANHGRYLSFGENRSRQSCENVSVANVDTLTSLAKSDRAVAPAELQAATKSENSALWKNPANQEQMARVKTCYLNGGNGAVPTNERSCYQTLNLKPTGEFKSYPTLFCYYDKNYKVLNGKVVATSANDGGVWRIKGSTKSYFCNGGVDIEPATTAE